jgi:hypothetical protein
VRLADSDGAFAGEPAAQVILPASTPKGRGSEYPNKISMTDKDTGDVAIDPPSSGLQCIEAQAGSLLEESARGGPAALQASFGIGSATTPSSASPRIGTMPAVCSMQ